MLSESPSWLLPRESAEIGVSFQSFLDAACDPLLVLMALLLLPLMTVIGWRPFRSNRTQNLAMLCSVPLQRLDIGFGGEEGTRERADAVPWTAP